MTTPSSAATVARRQNTSEWIKGIVFTALFGALFIAGSYMKIKLGFSAVPITLQTLAVILAGGLLGATYGFLSIFIVIILTATGLPLMGDGAGLSKMTGATAGFIWMFPIAAYLIGFVCDRLFEPGKRLSLPKLIALIVTTCLASLLLYVTGVPWLAHYSETLTLSTAIDKGMTPFLTGDALKAVAGALVIASLRPVIPAIRPRKPANRQ
ncbi:biotin transporter BioY [Cohnella sp. GCM10027633]|uniref:biotin transporter BioY n=1 Tax=unclassified Cohnella TaxID=2636738 RepID=UPI00364002A9